MRETYLIQRLVLKFVKKFVLRQKFVRNIFGKTRLPEIMFTQDFVFETKLMHVMFDV